MKPTVPDTGTVITISGDRAVVMVRGEKACRGCGAAEIGLCKAGGMVTMVEAANPLFAGVGDTVRLGLDRKVQRRGFLLAYIIPLAAFITGALAGHAAGMHLGVPALDVAAGFLMLVLSSLISFSRLRRLDRSSSLVVRENLSARRFDPGMLSGAEREHSGYSGCA